MNNADHNYLGKSNWSADSTFRGQMTEVRVWAVARTENQIRENVFKQLRGKEPGLVGLWNFANAVNGIVKDSTPGAHHGKLMGNARVVAGQLRVPSAAPQFTQALELDGNDSYVELPANLLANVKEVTVEGWVNWASFRNGSRFFDFGGGPFQFNVQNRGTASTLWFESPEGNRYSAVTLPDQLHTNEWVHVAVVRTTNGLHLVINGFLLPAVQQSEGSGVVRTRRSNA
jgi:Concanavalin A-like lectin/glucanases superfamily